MKKSYCRYCVIGVILGIVIGGLGGIYSEPVRASDSYYEIDFEAPQIKGNQYSSSFLVSQRNTSWTPTRFSVFDSAPRSGFLDFDIIPGMGGNYKTLGWFNFTYSKSKFITSITLGIGHITAPVSDDYLYFIFYNHTTQRSKLNFGAINPLLDTSNYMASIRLTRSVGNYYVQTCGYQNLLTTSSHAEVKIDIINGNGYQDYTYINSVGTEYTHATDVPDNSSSFTNGCRIDRCYVVGYNSGLTLYLDDCNFTVSDSYATGGGGGSPCGEVPGNDMGSGEPIGYPSLFSGTNYKSIEWEYDAHIEGDLWGVRLYLDPSMFDAYGGTTALTDYSLSISGFDVGSPDCIYSGGLYAVMQWLFTVPMAIDEGSLVFEAYATKAFSGSTYWSICKRTAVDVSDQLFQGLYYSVSDTRNGYANGDRYYDTVPHYSFYMADMGGIVEPDLYGHDYLSLDGEYGTNATGQVFARFVNPCVISGTVDDLSVERSIRIYNNGVVEREFLIENSYDYCFIYYPIEVSAHYNVTLMRGVDVFVRSIDFVVTNDQTSYNYSIVSLPVITYGNEQYAVYYRYFNLDGNDGVIACFLNADEYNMSNAEYTQLVRTNTSLTFIYEPTNIDWKTYWRLYVIRNGEYYEVGRFHVHYTMPINAVNEIMTIPSSPTLQNLFTIYGHHRFTGADVRVLLNGVFINNVGVNPEYEFTYSVSNADTYTLSLRWYSSNSSYIDLDTYSFSIASSSGAVSEYDTERASYNVMLGLAVVLGVGCLMAVGLHSVTIFPVGGMIASFIIAQPTMGAYQLFPTEVGAGVIVLCVIALIAMWLFD